MLFSSIPFLYYFLPSVLILYFIIPKCMKNVVLLFSSLIFYAWGEPEYILCMIASIVIGYISGLLIEAFRTKRLSTFFLILSVVINLGFLFYFKFSDYWPIGISFYTFQILSYTVDVYRGQVSAQRNILNLGTYVAMFPQLIAGPIVRYSQIAKELVQREHSVENCALGMRRFVFGLSKKVLLANVLGELCDIFKASDDKSILFYWLYAVAFTLHIYFDFSGYSDMAIGLGKIMGFHFPENFDYPYISKSMTEFWRRWHMSLGSWFRDYVYIPLGGNRVPKVRWFFNIFVVWALTGFWHGASLNFIVWGLFFAILLILEKKWLLKYLEKSKVLGHIYVIFSVIISFVIFNGADMGEALTYIGGMFGVLGETMISGEFIYYFRSYAVVLIVSIVLATPFCKELAAKAVKIPFAGKILNGLEPIVLLILMIGITAYLVDGSFNPFLYFRF